ncbi:hypothetical protein PI124_g11232 [Phytophthora idaei]|nr:hypothetical protein PI125_g11323 [Phytophthora idaei]KAG3152276.1 hypothetical protein PI126_g10579 [Phytophthora idaei]KAG3243938.1 hypothetical protein PI124_g11232 [Phytophthora idaei]
MCEPANTSAENSISGLNDGGTFSRLLKVIIDSGMAVCPEYNPTDDTLDVTMTFSTIANSGNVFYATMVVTTTNGGDACMVSEPTNTLAHNNITGAAGFSTAAKAGHARPSPRAPPSTT